MSVTKRSFGSTSKGEASLYILTAGACEAAVTDFGATLVSFRVADEKGQETDIVLGYDDAAGYEAGGDSFGATVGRNANRCAGAAFSINGKEYKMTANENGNNLHSGPDLYGKRLWKTEAVNEEKNSVTFGLFSPDTDQGFPGNLEVTVTYTLSEDGSLAIDYSGKSDQDTVCNLTNHVYFNLNGEGNGDICSQILQIFADQITPINDQGIPFGTYLDVKGTAYDFNTPKSIGADIDSDDSQIQTAHGYDQNYVVAANKGEVKKVAESWSEDNGVTLEVFTDLPGVQFYSGNFIQKQTGRGGSAYAPRTGFALETQFAPNALNTESFARPFLKAGENFVSRTVYKLSISEAHKKN